MSLETLLEAARYLDYKTDAKKRGEEPCDYYTFSKLYGAGYDISQLHSQQHQQQSTKFHPSTNASHPSPEEAKDRRRSSPSAGVHREPMLLGHEQGGIGTREVHNKLEKNRRAHLKECFEALKKQLPSMDDRKTSNLSILRGAVRYIQTLKRKEREYEHEMERLAREKIAFQQRFSSLKKDFSSHMDHIDVNAFIPEGDNETTTTASECGALSDFDDDLPQEVSSASDHNIYSVSDVTSSSSNSAVGSLIAKRMTNSTPVTAMHSSPALGAGGKTSAGGAVGVAHSLSFPNSENMSSHTARVVPAMAGILTTPHAVQVITQPSGIKVITAPNSVSSTQSAIQHLSVGAHQQGHIQVLTPPTTTYVTSAPAIAASTSKLQSVESIVQVAPSSAINSSKQSLVSPITLVSPQALVGMSQVAAVAKPIIINPTSNISELITSSVTSSSLSQGLAKSTPSVLSPSLISPPMAVTMKNTVQNSSTVSIASQSNMVATLHAAKSHPQVIQPSSAAQNISSLITSGGAQMNHVGRHVVTASVKPLPTSNAVRAPLSHIAGVAHVTHVMSQPPAAAPVSQLVSPGAHVPTVTPLMGSVSVVSHATAVHHPQIISQSQSLGKVLSSPLMKSVNQIPIIQQQFLQQAVGPPSAQPVVKPVVVVSVANVAPNSNVSTLPHTTAMVSLNDQRAVVQGPSHGPKP